MSEHNVSRSCPVCEAPLGANDGDYCQSCTYEPDAVEDANALCQAIRERDAFRDAAEQYHTELDAAGIGSRDQFLGDRIHVLVVERDALRKQVENWSNELADALGCVNEHNGARQQPCFAEMVEMVRRLRDERDGPHEALKERSK